MNCNIQEIPSRQQMVSEPHLDLAVLLQRHPGIGFDLHIGAVAVDAVLPENAVAKVAPGRFLRFCAVILQPQGDLISGAEHILCRAVCRQQGSIRELYLSRPQAHCGFFAERREFLPGECLLVGSIL